MLPGDLIRLSHATVPLAIGEEGQRKLAIRVPRNDMLARGTVVSVRSDEVDRVVERALLEVREHCDWGLQHPQVKVYAAARVKNRIG